MNDIIRAIIKWTEDNKIIPEIYFYSECGGIWLKIKLRKRGKCIAKEFYIGGGVLCLNNWSEINELEVNNFIETAKKELLGEGGG